MKCPFCGHELSVSAKICYNCGHEFYSVPRNLESGSSNLDSGDGCMSFIGLIIGVVIGSILGIAIMW